MKGKVSFYFNAPNIAKVRSRVENPSAEFTKNIRQAVNDTLIEVINENIISTRAKLAAKFRELGETVKSESAAEALGNVFASFWDVVVSDTPFRDEETEEHVAPTEEVSSPDSPTNDEFED